MDLTNIVRYIIIPLIFGSYIFTFFAYRLLASRVDEILVNHLTHHKEEMNKLWRAVEKLESKK